MLVMVWYYHKEQLKQLVSSLEGLGMRGFLSIFHADCSSKELKATGTAMGR